MKLKSALVLVKNIISEYILGPRFAALLYILCFILSRYLNYFIIISNMGRKKTIKYYP